MENRAPPSFQAEAAATAAQSALPPWPQGLRARSRPGPGRAAAGGRTEGAGTRQAALKRRSWQGRSSVDARAPARGGGGAVQRPQRSRWAGGRRSPAQRRQPSVKGFVPAPQSGARPRPLGPSSGRPTARKPPAAAHLHPGWARAELWRTPQPRLRSRAARAAGQFVP